MNSLRLCRMGYGRQRLLFGSCPREQSAALPHGVWEAEPPGEHYLALPSNEGKFSQIALYQFGEKSIKFLTPYTKHFRLQNNGMMSLWSR